MHRGHMRILWVAAGTWLLAACMTSVASEPEDSLAGAAAALTNNEPQPNSLGSHASFSSTGTIASSGAFFDDLGTNGRRCVTCHGADQGFSITPARIALAFARSAGNDPLFRLVDGAVSPDSDVSTLAARRTAYALLLQRGLIRVGIGMPERAEFELISIDDPAGYASAKELSLFRRPLPATNLRFNAQVMWDGRESPLSRTFDQALLQQAANATLGHAQARTPLTLSSKRAIVDFELALTTGQLRDALAGLLYDPRAGLFGGPEPLASEPFYVGINDLLGDSKTRAPHDPSIFMLFDGWSETAVDPSPSAQARASIARGQRIFNRKRFSIRNTRGINDDPALGNPAEFIGTCGTCHNAPNVGSGSTGLFFDFGIGSPTRAVAAMPLYTFRERSTGATVQTTDPGRALVTGKWRDIQRFKVPGLRGLAARPPYFHDGRSITLVDVVSFYDGRFRMGMSASEKADLVAFLGAL